MEKEKINQMSSSLKKLGKATKCRGECRCPVTSPERLAIQPSGPWQETDGTHIPGHLGELNRGSIYRVQVGLGNSTRHGVAPQA